MIFTITDVETNIKAEMDNVWYKITDQRFNNKISFWITNWTADTNLYISWAWVEKNWTPEPLQTDTKPLLEWETVVYEEIATRLDKIRLQAWAGQSITVYVDVRL